MSKSVETTAYCMKCKKTQPMKDIEPVVMKNGKPAKRGVCAECGTKMFKIGAGSLVTGAAFRHAKKAVSKKAASKKGGVRKSKKASKKTSKKAPKKAPKKVSKKVSKKAASKKRKTALAKLTEW